MGGWGADRERPRDWDFFGGMDTGDLASARLGDCSESFGFFVGVALPAVDSDLDFIAGILRTTEGLSLGLSDFLEEVALGLLFEDTDVFEEVSSGASPLVILVASPFVILEVLADLDLFTGSLVAEADFFLGLVKALEGLCLRF